MNDLVVDGNSLFARAWYATSKDYINPTAVLRSALQTFCSLLNQEVGRIDDQIDRTLFCWDGDHGRDKGDHRQPKPPQFHETLAEFQDATTKLFGCAHACPPHHEADDAVATAVYSSEARRVYVVSGDKDLMQLQGKNVFYYCLNQNMVVSQPFVLKKFDVKHPSQIALALAILGDRIDNIPGIKGWGPKKVKSIFACVPDDANFQQALDAVVAQIPENLQEAFYVSLERTLLDPLLKGLPSPAPVRLATIEDMIDVGVHGMEDAYMRMYKSYTGENVSRPDTKVGFQEDY